MISQDAAKAVADILYRMENDVADVKRWGRAITDLGCCETDVSPDGLYAIGEALIRLGVSLNEQWSEAFRLTHSRPEEGN